VIKICVAINNRRVRLKIYIDTWFRLLLRPRATNQISWLIFLKSNKFHLLSHQTEQIARFSIQISFSLPESDHCIFKAV